MKKLEISKDGVIASLRLENKKHETEMEEKRQELQQVQNELSQVIPPLAVTGAAAGAE